VKQGEQQTKTGTTNAQIFFTMKAISLPSLAVLVLCYYNIKILFILSPSPSPIDYYCCTTAFSPKSIIINKRARIFIDQETKEKNQARKQQRRRTTDGVVLFPRCSSHQYDDCYIATENNNDYFDEDDDDDDDDDDNISNNEQNQNGNNDLDIVKYLTEVAIYHCGSEEGLDAMRELNKLCDRRLPFDFNNFNSRAHHNSIPATSNNDYNNNSNNTDNTSSCTVVDVDRGERVISKIPNFLPTKTTNEFLELVQYMEKQKWMSTNPDSVDGLPSLHLNLVSQGRSIFDDDDDDDKTNDSKIDETIDNDESSFGSHIYQLYNLVRPYVYENLLPTVDRLLNDNNNNSNNGSKNNKKLRVSDIFLRRYGQDICGDMTRNGISIHYDVFSRITAVIALDDVASNGDNGLFTLSVDETTQQTSNHKALRRYFPLNTGDCVVHTWDVLHGVDVQPGLDRTSLIVWFDEEEEPVNDDGDDQDNEKIVPVSPWLLLENQKNQANHNFSTMHDGNDVRQFVLASALASVEKTTTTTTTTTSPDSENDHEIWLYLRSASRGNTFALTRMGSICEEGILTCVDMQSEAFTILEKLRPFEKLPTIIQDMLKRTTKTTATTTATSTTINNNGNCLELACRFWFEAALKGNSLAQRALADEIMLEASQSGDPNQRLLAAVLFALASQQDDSESSESLSRVIEYDVAARNVGSQEEFLASPVVETANAAGTFEK
jgi:hypothetical protein